MTPDKRKRLRFNKSTPWYMKKYLSNNKTKIHEKILLKIQLLLECLNYHNTHIVLMEIRESKIYIKKIFFKV